MADAGPLLVVEMSAALPITVVTRPPGWLGAADVEPSLLLTLGSGVSEVLRTMLVMLVRVTGGTKPIVRVTVLPLAKLAIAGKLTTPVLGL